jgi:hypothetical protein
LGVTIDEGLQARLNDITGRLTSGEDNPSGVPNALLDACRLLEGRPTETIQQMILWTGQADLDVKAMLPLTLVSQCDITDKAVAVAIAPMLDEVYPADQTPREAAKKLLDDPTSNSPYEMLMMLTFRIEHPIETNGETVYDFSSYEPLVRKSLEEQEEMPGLFRHLFSRSPQEAIEIVAKSTGDRRIIQSLESDRRSLARYIEACNAERDDLVKSFRKEAETSLESVAGDARWWVRLYAVEIANRYPELIDEQRLRLLEKDRNTVVRGAVDKTALREKTVAGSATP